MAYERRARTKKNPRDRDKKNGRCEVQIKTSCLAAFDTPSCSCTCTECTLSELALICGIGFFRSLAPLRLDSPFSLDMLRMAMAALARAESFVRGAITSDEV